MISVGGMCSLLPHMAFVFANVHLYHNLSLLLFIIFCPFLFLYYSLICIDKSEGMIDDTTMS